MASHETLTRRTLPKLQGRRRVEIFQTNNYGFRTNKVFAIKSRFLHVVVVVVVVRGQAHAPIDGRENDVSSRSDDMPPEIYTDRERLRERPCHVK